MTSACAPRIGLGARDLSLVFPFHLVFGRDLRIVQVGDGFRRLLPGLGVGQRLDGCLRVLRPSTRLDFEAIRGWERSVFLLAALGREDLVLRGQMVFLEENDVLAFLGSPWISDLDRLRELDLSLADFAPHDSQGDNLFVLQTLRTSIADANRLVDELREVNHSLEERVRERTRELQAANEALESSLDELAIAQEQAVQADKMAAIGQLAAGIAHELNNPLAVILGFAQGLDRRVPEGDLRLHLPVRSILREAQRCQSLVGELLRFSRTASRPAEQVDLSALVGTALEDLAPRAEAVGVSISRELDERLPPLRGNPSLLRQLVLGLAANSLDAMPLGGRLALRTWREVETICLEVSDTGRGMPAEIRSRIFDPFFTTKEVGQGTGLGLSLVYETVHQHGGRIEVKSSPDAGTTVTIRLPLPARNPRSTASALGALSEKP